MEAANPFVYIVGKCVVRYPESTALQRKPSQIHFRTEVEKQNAELQ